jgi:stage IV sporulation protein FB
VFTFRLGPFPVTVEASFLIVAILLGPLDGSITGIVGWATVVFVSVLVHELGHALVAARLGGAPAIQLAGFGGTTFPRLAQRPTPAQSIALSLAGPLAGLLPALVSLALLAATNPRVATWLPQPRLWGALLASDGRSPFEELLFTFVRTGCYWTLLNLLPVYPLDGGHVLLSGLQLVRKKPSFVLAGRISLVTAVLLGGYTLLHGGQFLALFFLMFAIQSWQLARSGGAPRVVAVAGPADPAERKDADAGLEQARARLGEGDVAGAEAVIARLEAAGGTLRLAAAARIRAGLLLAGGETGRAGIEAGRAFSLVQEPDSAVVAARAALRAGEPEVARNWLQRALEAGASAQATTRSSPRWCVPGRAGPPDAASRRAG